MSNAANNRVLWPEQETDLSNVIFMHSPA